MKKNFFKIIGLIAIVAFVNLSCGGGDDNGVTPTGGGLTSDIDDALFGTWKDSAGGNSLTITFSEDGIIWGGTAGNSLNAATNAYQGTGYDFVWIADNGTISYKYSDPSGNVNTIPVYTYIFNSSGGLELSAVGASGSGSVTMVESDPGTPGGDPGTPGGNLTNDIDAALFGTWKDNIDGTTLTITFSETGIIWGGIAGNSLNNTTSMYQGTGYTFVWIANNGTISYKYSYNNGTPMTTPAIYTYAINSSGELELSASGYVFATLVKGAPGGDPGTPGGSLTNDIDAALFGTWKDNIDGTTLTITFSETGIIWGGIAGNSLNNTTSMYQGTGYTFVWIANNGTISYKYSYNNGAPMTTPAVYTYALNSSGELELRASGYLFATLVKGAPGGDPGTPGGSLTNDIDAALFGTWKDNIGGTTVIITFSEDGITWAGTAGDSLNSTTSMYQGTGYTFVWIANNGTISYKYSYNNGTPASMPVYTYALNSSGELELKVSGYLFVTLVNEAISGGNTYTITFDANDGGSGGPTSVKVEYEQPMPDLSGQTLPTRAGVRHVFTGYFDAQTGGTKYYNNNLTSARDWDKESDATLYAQWAMDYEIGDVGPGGGIIFYVSEAGFTVTNYGTAHYLEAAPADMAEWLEWDEYGTLIDGTGRGIGSGRDNTDHILNIVPTAPAALACRNYTGGGKTDWFLPSLDELNELYVQKDIVGGFTYDFYWSSSEYYSVYAYDQLFGTGVQSNYYKGETYSVRAVRAF